MRKLCSLICLLLFSTLSCALLPPQYLSVPEWKNCVGSTQKDGAEFICLPSRKPTNCPQASWQNLAKLNEIEACPQIILK